MRWNFTTKLEDLDFVDDIALLSSRFQDLQRKATSVNEQSERVDLKKSKIMRPNTNNREKIEVNGEELEEMNAFTYLSGVVTTHDGYDEDIKN